MRDLQRPNLVHYRDDFMDWVGGAYRIVDDLVMRGHNLRNFCRDVLGHLRDLLVVKVSGDPKLLDSSSALTDALQQQAALFSQADLVRFFHSLAETEASLKEAANPRFQVEVGLRNRWRCGDRSFE
jgi:DNA polymerase-3 subunit gamma/tau